MAKQFGENIAKHVQQGRVRVNTTSWTLLSANGTSNLEARTHMRLQTRGKAVGEVLALAYANQVTNDGISYTATAPTHDVGFATQFRGTWVEPVGPRVNVYGRLVNKAGATGSASLNVVVTEFA